MKKYIRTATPPSLYSQPDVMLLRKPDFEAAIWLKGYEVILEHAVACPCRGNSGEARPTCKNCMGLGWIFINASETRALITSINFSTKYKDWSPELTGTISVTVRDQERLSFMDKITFKTRYSVLSEVRPLLELAGSKFIFTSYVPKAIRNVFMFVDDSSKLYQVPPSLYSIKEDRNIVEFSLSIPNINNGVVSIDYEHETSYNVIDIPHDLRSTFVINESGETVEYEMPIQAIARRSHIIMGIPTNYDNSDFVENNIVELPSNEIFTSAYDVFVGVNGNDVINGHSRGDTKILEDYIIFSGFSSNVFNKLNRGFWAPNVPIYNNSSRRWKIEDFNEGFVETYGTDDLKKRLFFKPYGNSIESIFPILSYQTNRSEEQVQEINDIFSENLFIFENGRLKSKSK